MVKFHSVAGRLVGGAWLVLTALNVVDIALRGRDVAALLALAVVVFGAGLAVVFGLRPGVFADDTGVHLRNPLRDVRVPWPAFESVDGGDGLIVRYRDPAGTVQTVRSWILRSSARRQAAQRRRAALGTALSGKGATGIKGAEATGRADAGGSTPSRYAAEQLRVLAGAHNREAALRTAGSAPEPEPTVNSAPDSVTEPAADRAEGGSAVPATAQWSRPAIAALAVPGVFLAIVGMIAVLG